MQAEGVYSEILHRQPEAEAKTLDVSAHFDVSDFHPASARNAASVFRPASVSPPPVLPFLTRKQQSRRGRRFKMMFDKQSSYGGHIHDLR